MNVTAACGAVILRFHGFSMLSSSNLWYLRIVLKVLVCAFGGFVYVGWSLSPCVSPIALDITGAKEMCSISVSHSKVLRFLVVG